MWEEEPGECRGTRRAPHQRPPLHQVRERVGGRVAVERSSRLSTFELDLGGSPAAMPYDKPTADQAAAFVPCLKSARPASTCATPYSSLLAVCLVTVARMSGWACATAYDIPAQVSNGRSFGMSPKAGTSSRAGRRDAAAGCPRRTRLPLDFGGLSHRQGHLRQATEDGLMRWPTAESRDRRASIQDPFIIRGDRGASGGGREK